MSSRLSIREPREDFIDNTIGTFNVCEICRLLNIPLVFNSSMKVYPGEDKLHCPYGLSKSVGEEYIKVYNQLYNLQFVINRPSTVYGPLQEASEDGGWVTHFIKSYIANKVITLFGDGTQSRDILYIDDMISLLVDEIDNFNLYSGKVSECGGGEVNELSLLQLLEFLTYRNVEFGKRLKGDMQRFVCDNTPVSSINNWKPKVCWKEGVNLTREFYEK